MELFYSENFLVEQDEIELSPRESHHIARVLRKKVGEIILMTDGKGHLITGKIIEVQSGKLILKVIHLEKEPFPVENSLEVALAIVRPNRMDWAVEKITELGVKNIQPVFYQYSSESRTKRNHLQKIAINAIKQSNQFYLPEINEPLLFKEWISTISPENSYNFLAHPDGRSIKDLLKNEISPDPVKINLAIGPEGGFHTEELQLAYQYNFQLMALGTTVLRAETAAVSAVTLTKLFF